MGAHALGSGLAPVLQSLPLWLIFVVTTLSILAAGELGRRIGVRRAALGSGNIGALEGAVLGLLTLMISFTFAMALARFDARRDAVVAEANAIGTTALRARLLPAPLSSESLVLLREYVRIHLAVGGRSTSAQLLDRALARSGEIQEQLWQIAGRAQKIDSGMVPTGLFVGSLNEMIDNEASRLAHFRNRVPEIVLWVLYGIAIVGIGFAGFADGLANRSRQAPLMVTALVVAVAIWLIQDLDRAEAGFLRTDVQPLIDTAASLDRMTP